MKIIELNKERHIIREKELLSELKHTNIIELYSTFKDNTNLYFVFEIGPNGTLDDLIKKLRGNFNEKII
jgi:3-phosphoinositide dependent protein kinase-1